MTGSETGALTSLPDRPEWWSDSLVGASPRALYEMMVRIRAFEEGVRSLSRRGAVTRLTHLSIGQEAVAAGVCLALSTGDHVLSTHRSHGHFIAWGADPRRAMAEIAGRSSGYCGGKGGTMHLADIEGGFLGSMSIVGGGLPLGAGAALWSKQSSSNRVCVCFFGEGAINTGNFAESMNFAAYLGLPLVMICENNQFTEYTLSDRLSSENSNAATRALAYGVRSLRIDGNDVGVVHDAALHAMHAARYRSVPVLLECLTYRMEGHSTLDNAAYRDEAEIERWRSRDPLDLARRDLLESSQLTVDEDVEYRRRVDAEMLDAVEFALQSAEPSDEVLLNDLFVHPYPDGHGDERAEGDEPGTPHQVETRRITYREALNEALKGEMQRDDRVFLLGEDIGRPGGVFGVTRGLWELFGDERVIDTPISENTIVGAGIGAALAGGRPVVEIMFADLIFLAADQLLNVAAKIRYMSGGQARLPFVLRLPSGAGVSAGPTHSQSLEALFCHVPGLKVAMPSCAGDALGLLQTAIRCDDPVVFIEQKSLYGVADEVPLGCPPIPFGVANVLTEGSDVSLLATGAMVRLAVEVADRLSESGVGVEVIDPRTLVPLDLDCIVRSVRKTKRLMVLEEACVHASFGSDVVARIQSLCWADLAAPAAHLGCPPVPWPFAKNLERLMYPSVLQVEATLLTLLP